jgi:adenylate cyclase, class 2
MPVNLELKAKYPNIKRAESIARELAREDPEIAEQIDTYFKIAHGRLKHREIHAENGTQQSELIWYERDEDGRERYSRYERTNIDPSSGMYRILENALEIDVRVTKRRTVYLWNDCRIHIDIVDRLGPFVEFEVLESGGADERERLGSLIDAFGITDLDTINCSYADLARTIDADY